MVIGDYGAYNDTGAAYVVFGHVNPWVSSFSLANLNGTNGFKLIGTPQSLSGYSVSGIGDFNNDSFDDIAIGAYNFGDHQGIVYVIFGSKGPWPSPTYLSILNRQNGFNITSFQRSDLGLSVSGAGDMNGDGIGDLLIGAQFANDYTGAAYVIFGNKGPWPSTFSVARLNGTNGFNLTGFVPNSQTGHVVSGAGDVSGDGVSDIVIGTPFAHSNTGAGYVILGHREPWHPTVYLNSLDGRNGFYLIGSERNLYTSCSVSRAGDINADGIGDLLIGSFNSSQNTGPVYVIFGRNGTWPVAISLSSLNGTNGFTVTDIQATSWQTGSEVSGIGDFNNDSIDDFLIGAPRTNDFSGMSYVISGRKGLWPSTFSVTHLNGTNGFALEGIKNGGQSGRSVSSAGDVNHDGINDLIIGSPAFTEGKEGASYVVFGGLKPPLCNLTLSDNGKEIHVKQAILNEERHKDAQVHQDNLLLSDDHKQELSFQNHHQGRKILEFSSWKESSWNHIEWIKQKWQSFTTWLYRKTEDKKLLSPIAQRLDQLRETFVKLQEEAPRGIHSYYHHDLQDLIDDMKEILKQPETVTDQTFFEFRKNLKRIKKDYGVTSRLMQSSATGYRPKISPTLSPIMLFNVSTANLSLPTAQPQYLGN